MEDMHGRKGNRCCVNCIALGGTVLLEGGSLRHDGALHQPDNQPECAFAPGGTQILFEASKPVPIFKGHFGGKGYPLLGTLGQENDVFVYFSDEKGENI